MRIIIEVEPGASQAVVEMESAALKAGMAQAIDGGPPAQYLLDALGTAVGEPGMERSSQEEPSRPAQVQDAGGVPGWLVEVVESSDQNGSTRLDGE